MRSLDTYLNENEDFLTEGLGNLGGIGLPPDMIKRITNKDTLAGENSRIETFSKSNTVKGKKEAISLLQSGQIAGLFVKNLDDETKSFGVLTSPYSDNKYWVYRVTGGNVTRTNSYSTREKNRFGGTSSRKHYFETSQLFKKYVLELLYAIDNAEITIIYKDEERISKIQDRKENAPVQVKSGISAETIRKYYFGNSLKDASDKISNLLSSFVYKAAELTSKDDLTEDDYWKLINSLTKDLEALKDNISKHKVNSSSIDYHLKGIDGSSMNSFSFNWHLDAIKKLSNKQ